MEGLERLERFKGLGAGKRQAWTPIRSHGCGLGRSDGSGRGVDRPEEAMDLALGSLLPALEAGLGTPVGCEGLANGTRDRPEEAMDRALGSLLPALDAHKKPSMGGFRGVEGLERLEPIDAFAEF